MKILNLLNGPEGCQMGIEDGFRALEDANEISTVCNIYLKTMIDQKGLEKALQHILALAESFQFDVIIFYHISGCNIPRVFYQKLKRIASKPTIVLDDHDGYERFKKNFPQETKMAMAESHIISLCGLGAIVAMVPEKDRHKILYTPHQTTIQRLDRSWLPTQTRKYDVIMIGNRVTSRIPFKRLSGARERETIVAEFGKIFGSRFAVYGYGWEGFIGNKGRLPYEKQFEALRESWISIGVDHCTKMSYYFSDRLPISMFSGVAHICHYHKGYDVLFDHGKDLLWFKNPSDAVDTVRVALSRGPEYLIKLGLQGRAKAKEMLAPDVVWRNFIHCVKMIRRENDVQKPGPELAP